ncbi:TetR/AcrR family transcriptional regulator [Peribacillus huizhouensis]|uniref:TetR/AcrR family transcriptional repressor of lmrAB and yxaGH operons n=1 Tax=Peribacillus huizhouensis TaxID=1501239 RepID=A0ABR6CKJ5_9BACI|nr:TetR/AcrR family transcriptional regulator [Peribacillus huizhouensis]MBA9025582.1 TetR/AcrR family transcriptional repressor of lmrAB and yxaGH operons [Peribacillus huizhouensis]
MDTKSQMIEIATNLFQQKGYKGVGVNEILKVCNITKGALYHHFPNGKEELLIACLKNMDEAITTDIEVIFERCQTTMEALHAMIEKLVANLDREGTITGYTFSSIVSEMASLSEPVRNACSDLYTKMQGIYSKKLVADGFSKETAHSIALMMTATIEGGIMLCLTRKTSEPLKIISQGLPNLLKGFI